MPERCKNILMIEGSQSEIDKFMETIRYVFVDYGNLIKNRLVELEQIMKSESEENDELIEKEYIMMKEVLEGVEGEVTLFASFYRPDESELEHLFETDWNIANYGTKWDVHKYKIIKKEDGCIKLQFETMWTPPILWVKRVKEIYPQLNFTLEYIQEGEVVSHIFST